MKADQMAWLPMPMLTTGSLECWPMKAFLAMLMAAAGRLTEWLSHVADDLQAKLPALPLLISSLAVPSFCAFPRLACATFGH